MEKEKNIFYLVYFVYKKFSNQPQFRKYFPLYFLLSIFDSLTPIAWSYVLARLIDQTIQAIENSMPIQTLLPWFGIFAVTNLLSIFISYSKNTINAKINMNLLIWENDIFIGKKTSLEPKVFEDPVFMVKYNMMEWNDWRIYDTFENTILVFSYVVTILVSLFALTAYSWELAIFAILSAIPAAIIVKVFGQRVWNIWNDKGEEKIKYSGYRWPLNTTNPSEMQEIYIFKYGKYLLSKMREFNASFTSKLNATENRRYWWSLFAGLITLVFTILSFIFSINLVLTGAITIGVLTFVISAYQQFQYNISDVFNKVSFIWGNKKLLSVFYEIQNYENTLKSGEILAPKDGEEIKLEFRNVWFKYPGTSKWVLKDISMNINEDEDLALVGRNGAGKSTIIKLAMRIYDPDKGEILVNGENIKNIDLDKYYEKIAILSQSFNKLSIPAEENIYIGNTSVENNETLMKKAAKDADIDDVLTKLPFGYKTFLNRELKDGVELSGGQWQKLAIARAFYRDAKLLILDEPTSAVDALSEEKIFDNIRENAKNKTTLIVSHRFATVRKAKRIIVINNGEIVEDGKHEDLMNQNGLYAKMYRTQVEKI